MCHECLAAVLALLSTAAPSGTVLEAGLCEQPKVTERYSQPQSLAGYATLGDLFITKKTDEVPLRKGIDFGFLWRAQDLPENIQVRFVVSHPPITRPDGRRMQSFSEPMAHHTVNGSLQTIDCYGLEEDFELDAGDWSLTS